MNTIFKTGIGQDSHRFETADSEKKLILGGVTVDGHIGLSGNSDADVILHAITNAVSGITGVNILGSISDRMCQSGITSSTEYLKKALSHLSGNRIVHVSVTLECKTPILEPLIPRIKESVALLLDISVQNIGITATSGEGLTDFGKGLGIQCFAIITMACPQ